MSELQFTFPQFLSCTAQKLKKWTYRESWEAKLRKFIIREEFLAKAKKISKPKIRLNETQNLQTKSSGKISTVLTTKSLICDFHTSNEAQDRVSCPFREGLCFQMCHHPPCSPISRSAISHLIPDTASLLPIFFFCKPQMHCRFQTQEVVLICWHSRILFLSLLQSQK